MSQIPVKPNYWMEDSSSSLKLLKRKKVERSFHVSEVIVMCFEGLMGGWIPDQPG